MAPPALSAGKLIEVRTLVQTLGVPCPNHSTTTANWYNCRHQLSSWILGLLGWVIYLYTLTSPCFNLSLQVLQQYPWCWWFNRVIDWFIFWLIYVSACSSKCSSCTPNDEGLIKWLIDSYFYLCMFQPVRVIAPAVPLMLMVWSSDWLICLICCSLPLQVLQVYPWCWMFVGNMWPVYDCLHAD